MAAATMMLMPRHMAATTIASALLCFSTISAHMSTGVILSMIRKQTQKTMTPTSA